MTTDKGEEDVLSVVKTVREIMSVTIIVSAR